jgi:hypothetical protein
MAPQSFRATHFRLLCFESGQRRGCLSQQPHRLVGQRHPAQSASNSSALSLRECAQIVPRGRRSVSVGWQAKSARRRGVHRRKESHTAEGGLSPPPSAAKVLAWMLITAMISALSDATSAVVDVIRLTVGG